MGAWDALGQGIQAGVQNWMEQKRLAEEKARRLSTEGLQREQLGLEREQAGLSRQIYEEGTASREGQERETKYRRLSDYSDPAKGIFVYEYDELSPGAYVPVPREEQFNRYREQSARYQQEQAEEGSVEHKRRLEEIETAARLGHQYSYPPAHVEKSVSPQFFVNGEVNPSGAFDALQFFITEYAGGNTLGFWADPKLQARFLQDVELKWGQTIPGARGKAEQWLYRKSQEAAAATPPAEKGPGFFSRVGTFLEGMPYGGKPAQATAPAAPAAPNADPVYSQIEQQVRLTAGDDTPEEMIQVLIKQEYNKYLRSVPIRATPRGAMPPPTEQALTERKSQGQFNTLDLSRARW